MREFPRTAAWTYQAGSSVHEPTGPAGTTYVMESYSQQVDPTLSWEQSDTLGDRLTVPPGWSYSSRVLSKISCWVTGQRHTWCTTTSTTAIRRTPPEPHSCCSTELGSGFQPGGRLSPSRGRPPTLAGSPSGVVGVWQFDDSTRAYLGLVPGGPAGCRQLRPLVLGRSDQAVTYVRTVLYSTQKL